MGLPRADVQVSAACVAMDLQLEMDAVSFGQATLHSRITKPMMLQNRGDLPSTWKLDKSMLAPDFSGLAFEGYLQPHEDTNIEITFHPASVNRDIRYERIPVYVDGQAPLPLTLTGMCVEASAETTPLVFKTQVRVPVTQKIAIKNTSTGPWLIKPVVQDDQWSGPELLEVAAGQSAEYIVTYCPVNMTKELLDENGAGTGAVDKHRGTVFFPLADGSAILYSLEGEGRTLSRRQRREELPLQEPSDDRARGEELAQAAAALPRRHSTLRTARSFDQVYGAPSSTCPASHRIFPAWASTRTRRGPTRGGALY